MATTIDGWPMDKDKGKGKWPILSVWRGVEEKVQEHFPRPAHLLAMRLCKMFAMLHKLHIILTVPRDAESRGRQLTHAHLLTCKEKLPRSARDIHFLIHISRLQEMPDAARPRGSQQLALIVALSSTGSLVLVMLFSFAQYALGSPE
ncbi:hypothetical protein BC827DRAFT_1157268 [Russula dissimulans]|nr:hypothetical protein BC827DRAFT_1157268 [Russula dissimulans]